MKKALFLVALAATFLLDSCAPGYDRYISSYQQLRFTEEPDYTNLNNWAAHPYKWDPSDSVPAPLKADYFQDSSVDVFFLHPTTLTEKEDTQVNASVQDLRINAKTDYSSMLYQASAFNEYRVFAPRYRQAHIRSYFIPDTAAAKQAFEKAYQDIRKAFAYYLDHYNGGRPIIIASHSQGSTHAVRLLREFFDQSPLRQRLVAAWVVGMYVPVGSFQNIPVCQQPAQTGCYCAWRTYRDNYTPERVKKEPVPASVINPITWTMDLSRAAAASNKGSVLQDFNKVRLNVASARIGNGVLWTSRPRFPGSILMLTRNYHIGDINLYYMDIRTNVRQRVNQFKRMP